ncbi:GIY-YIG nuclease family protein [Demequina sp.]|uniref:GIY-YIG nuclease family protein n=1 Tax=Demequina sp. TaxID=2050685 RepID=UPI0025C3C3D8|nr:GIY-YIG nuclease family protein [Demequina sp.]
MTGARGGESGRWQGNLTLGDVLISAGVQLSDVLAIRHTFKEEGLASPSDATAEGVMTYTRRQGAPGGKFPKQPPRWWLVFLADGGRRSRLYGAYENFGDVEEERDDVHRFYDLVESDLLHSLDGRLVAEWSSDSINWAKRGAVAASFPVVETSDPDAVPFPGFDRIALSYAQLQEVMSDSRYASWQTALGAVQGIYLIVDRSTGKLYVGKADGAQRILGRWKQYAETAHGGNVALREALGIDPERAQHFTWSLLRVFGSNTTPDEVDRAESHFKETLQTRKFGYNLN